MDERRHTPPLVARHRPAQRPPEDGGLLPDEALKAVRMAAREGLCGMDLVEIAPPYDVHDMTAQLGARINMDVLATLVDAGHLGRRRRSS
jgi:arginase family enzyme